MFYTEIQDAYKNGTKNNFWEKSSVDSADTLGIKTFNKIVLSGTVSEINAFVFYTEIQDGHQKWRENDLWEMSPVDSADILEGKKFERNHSISHRFRYKCVYVFYTEIQDGCQKSGKTIFGKSHQLTLGIP